MVPENEMCQLANYAASSQYKEPPSPEQIASGVIPLDSLPAAWWNWFWNENNKATNCARTYLTSLITELNNVLDAAGVCPQAACMDQLKQSIRILSRRIATANEAGAVVSDTSGGNVSVNATTGVMTANGLGNVTNLTTSVKTDVVAALNNVWGNFSACASSWNTCLASLQNNKAPNNHATNTLTYGGGTNVNYGHVKLSDTYSSCVGSASESVAASQKALADAYAAITSTGYVVLGNTVGCALGTASAGSAITAARSDHVHPNTGLWCLDSNDIYPGLSMGCCGSGGGSDYTQWVRSPLCGFIPYCANATSGFGCVGTMSYPFKEMWSKCFVGNLTGVALYSSYLASPSAAGIVTDDYGNIRPRTANNLFNWNISNAADTSYALMVYFETGNVCVGNCLFSQRYVTYGDGGFELYHQAGTPYIDFHSGDYGATGTEDFDTRLIRQAPGQLTVYGPGNTIGSLVGNLIGAADTALRASRMVGNYYITCMRTGSQTVGSGDDFWFTISPLERPQALDNYIYCRISLHKVTGYMGCIYVNNNSGMDLYYGACDPDRGYWFSGMVPAGAQGCCVGDMVLNSQGYLYIGPYVALTRPPEEALIHDVGPYKWVP